MLPPPRTISNLSQPLDSRDSFSASSTPFLTRNQLSTPTFSNYPYTYSETPRSILTGTTHLSLSPGASPYSNAHMASGSAQNFGTTASECAGFPWGDLESVNDITCEGQLLVPKVLPKVEKGFFADGKTWTCYRRNYFAVACGFELHPNMPNGRLSIRRGNNKERVQAMGMRLSAAIDGPDSKSIELIQHTPKRDLGPKTKIEIVKIAPKQLPRQEQTLSPSGLYQVPIGSFHPSNQQAGPYLPLQGSSEPDAQAGASQTPQSLNQLSYGSTSSQSSTSSDRSNEHTFERVQFKQATANNGKRRATQQFFRLIVELFADVRKEGSEKPVWVKVAQRTSDKIVVRGRSPSHYQNEKPDVQAFQGRALQGGSAGGYAALAGSTYASLNAGAFRSVPNTYISTNGVGVRKGDFYSDHGSQSDSSNSSLEEQNGDSTYGNDTIMTDAERVALHEHEGYQYYPNAMYEHMHATQLPPIAKLNGDTNMLNDPKMYAVKAEFIDTMPGAHYQNHNYNRFQGVDTSRGYFQDLQRF